MHTLAPGFAVVSGFSGAVPNVPTQSPGADPADRLMIDLNGPSLRTVDARSLGAPPRGQVVPAAKPLTVRAGDIGQVFAVALDDASPPNIYAAATSAYGLSIVVPDRNGDGLPERVRQGTQDASFMSGLFGPMAEAGPGTIWRVDPLTGQASIFVNVTFDGRPNSGAALGGLVFDRGSRLLFVSDRETGVIHSFALDGREVARFDHGVDGFAALGLPPLPHDPTRRLDIMDAGFDTTDSATWNYAPPVRRTFGLAVHRSRLYYAVAAGARIFSVALTPGGSFTPDVRMEYALPPSSVPGTEVSKIVFDDAGHMIVAERAPPTGAFDFNALTAHNAGRVLRLRAKPPGSGGTPYHWADAGEFAIGFPFEHRNGDGGIAIGMGYDAAGFLNFTACGGTLWSTGSQLRITDNPVVGQRLAAGGPALINGLQGNSLSLLRPQNAPPFASYFIDFDDVSEQAGTPGHMGDVAAWRACPGSLYPMVAELLFEESFCPVGTYFSGNQCLASPCRPGEFYRGGVCERLECVANRRDPLCCPPGTKWNPRTQRCDKPQPRRPDLAIKKEIFRCGPTGCRYRIVVTNVGDAPYSGVILVGDYVQPGQITSVTGPTPQWQCMAASPSVWACLNPTQPTTLAPNGTLEFWADVQLPPGKPWKNCAAVVGEKAKETNIGNNRSCVEGGGDDPRRPGRPNISVKKTAPKSCTRVSGNTYRCEFTISVTNDGTADHTGEVVVSDLVSTGHLVSIGGGAWTCGSGSSLSVCRNPGGIRAGETQSFPATVEVTVGPDGGAAENCVAPSEVVRRGSLPARTRLAASDIRSLIMRFAEGPLPPEGGNPGGPSSGQTPPTAPTSPPVEPPLPAWVCATVTIAGEPICPAGTVRTLRGGCCTPESIAAGTCLPRTGDTCSPPNVQIGNQCCTPAAMAAGACGQTQACPDGSRPRNGVCPTPRCPVGMVQQAGGNCCPRELARSDGTCGGTSNTCPFPLIQMGSTCCSREGLAAGTCGLPPTISCPPGSRDCPPKTVSDCPGGFKRVDGICPGTGTGECRPGQTRNNDGSCQNPIPRCRTGTRWDGTKCARPGGDASSCQKGFVWDGKRCVRERSTEKPQRCKAGSSWDGQRCVPQRIKKPPKPTKPDAGSPSRGIRPTLPGVRPGIPERRFTPPVQRGPAGPIQSPPQRGRGRG